MTDKSSATELDYGDRFELMYWHQAAERAKAQIALLTREMQDAQQRFTDKRDRIWTEYALGPNDELNIDAAKNVIVRR